MGKKKKPDYRKWANKHLKPGAMPIAPQQGFGEGKVLYCPKCDIQSIKSIYTDKWYCKTCGSELIKMTKDELNQMRNNA